MSGEPLKELEESKRLGKAKEFEGIEGRNDPKGLDQVKEPGEEGEGSNGKEYSGEQSNGRQIKRGTVFHPFMRLPAELRLVIWKLALPEPYSLRRFYPGDLLTCGPDCYLSTIFNPEVFDMPLAWVCRESRAFVFDYRYRPVGPHIWRYSKHDPQFCRCLDNVDNLSEDVRRLWYYDD
ncbi:hypothetical protein GGR55DRAFT_696561 [Xylaria sp. FL0064]|nr:hypothetical protein GGR55DRAFT_696561 [Xylaria sp. FL0064]